ncbi:hypothetical protein [Mycolicibacillus koreensis]|nr:hypothetical protein [Mycolicibacillus koreensis]
MLATLVTAGPRISQQVGPVEVLLQSRMAPALITTKGEKLVDQ